MKKPFSERHGKSPSLEDLTEVRDNISINWPYVAGLAPLGNSAMPVIKMGNATGPPVSIMPKAKAGP